MDNHRDDAARACRARAGEAHPGLGAARGQLRPLGSEAVPGCGMSQPALVAAVTTASASR